jgi:cytochrome c biogenesis protein CcmG, thiol:disulfide interchange protein DsbE
MPLRRLLYALPIVLLVLFGWLAWRGLAPDRNPSALPSALIGQPVPQFDLPPLDPAAAKLATADVAGHVTVINFFASWCLPCKAEHPLLFALGKDYGVPVYGIAFKDKPAATAAYIQELGSPYAKIGLDESGRTGLDFGLMGVPETFILDQNGIVRYRLPMPLDPDRIRDEIGPLLKKLQP